MNRDWIRPLSELDEVDWSSYRHSYGSAENVPTLLRQVASEDFRAGAEALDDLSNSIFHQGIAPDEVFLPVLPFWLWLVLNGPEVHRPELLNILHQVLHSMKDFRAFAWDEGYYPPDWLALQQRLLGLDSLFTPLLNDTNLAVAIAAGRYFNVLALYNQRLASERLKEIVSTLPDERQCVAVGMHLAELLKDEEVPTSAWDDLVKLHDEQTSQALRWMLALVLAEALRNHVPDSVITTLKDVLMENKALDELLGPEVLPVSSVVPSAIALDQVGKRAESLAPLLAEQLRIQEYGSYWIEKAILHLTFEPIGSLTPESLNPMQREVLHVLADYHETKGEAAMLALTSHCPGMREYLDTLWTGEVKRLSSP
ncbi:hypothetical protein [Deinococcus fonticola]|uniref:hypothetical protein n=1 Tax=Deinococcus fonticola TaxID=2528713 RepID=UPI001074D39B|nr:hypothetical protein [Deinococcus fonticola]